MRHLLRATLVVAGLSACGGDGDGSLTSYEGVYTIASWTENLAGCDAEGSSVLDQRQPAFYIKTNSFFGARFVNVVTCDTIADCQSLANDPDTVYFGGFSFDTGSDDAGWRSTTAYGFAANGQCNGSVIETVMTSPAGGEIRIESRETDAAPFPVDPVTECPDEAVVTAAAGQPCTHLEVVSATFASEL